MDSKDSPPQYDRGNFNLKAPFTDAQRLSMEDEHRSLPEGWVRQLDPSSAHHFYVDTTATPPRSIWVHPYDDPQWQQEQRSRPLSPDFLDTGRSSPPPPSEKRSIPTAQDNSRGLMGTLATGGAIVGGLALLDRYKESKYSTSPPPPPQNYYPNQVAGPVYQGGPPVYQNQAYGPVYQGGRERHGLLGSLGARRDARLDRRDDRRSSKDKRKLLKEEAKIDQERIKEMRKQQEYDMKHGYMERRRLVGGSGYGGGFGGPPVQYPNTPMYTNYGYQGGPAYPPPQMVYDRQETDYGRHGDGGGMGMLGGFAGGLILGDIIGGDGGDGGGDGGD
ncbi:hypothetical protein FRB95_012032 [Tulasnella sp. JGI-2019a]|nr:hypothetical protein FRB95_012032 [Tulasnella sp. JGI-2019a]